MGPTLTLVLIILCFHGEAKDIHDVLAEYGFPRGLLPNNAVSYTLSSDGTISVQLEAPCYVYWKQQLVYYDTQIKGTLTYASISHVSGIQAQKLFVWFPVTGITLHQRSAMLQFFVGPFSQTFPAADFQDVPACTRSSLSLSLGTSNESSDRKKLLTSRQIAVENEKEDIDNMADAFIRNFRKQLKIEREKSFKRFQDMINRGT